MPKSSRKQPSGRALLRFILNKYSLDKDRGASLSQHHLLSLKLHRKDVKSLEDFRQKMLYIMGALKQSEMPQESALRSMLYENVKHHPLMALAIDQFRSAREGSSKRSSKWLLVARHGGDSQSKGVPQWERAKGS